MNTYEGLHAEHYDAVYRDKPYAKEARIVDSLIREARVNPARLLDLACGTGRHAAEFALLGWDVTGVDYSEALLERARVNAPTARFLLQDMRKLDVPGKAFDAVTCLFDSIGYALEDEAVVATLERACGHLERDGILVIEFLHDLALRRDASPLRIRRFDLSEEGDELLRISRTSLDERCSIMNVEFELLELRADGMYERWIESQANRYFSVDEMRTFLGHAGFKIHRFLSAYNDHEITDDTFHVLAVASPRR